MSQVNRNFKSSVFTHLFREDKREFELYNAVAPGHFPPGTPVKDVTLSNALFVDRVNDLSFVLGDKLVVFFEHQSTINQNMPLRDLIYCSKVYENIIDSKALYSSKQVKIPTPEFYVLYNGKATFPEKAVYRLSDMYAANPESEPSLELIVNVFNVNKGFNSEIIKRSEALSGYVTLVSKIRELKSTGVSLGTAGEEAVKYCIDNGILVDYLKKHGSEVTSMLLEEWDWEKAREVWESEAKAEGKAEGIAEGKAEGIAVGERSKAYEIAKNLLKTGMPVSDISAITDLSVEEIEELSKSNCEACENISAN